jgi:hypothetical protein
VAQRITLHQAVWRPASSFFLTNFSFFFFIFCVVG